jgi:hypothetical protein
MGIVLGAIGMLYSLGPPLGFHGQSIVRLTLTVCLVSIAPIDSGYTVRVRPADTDSGALNPSQCPNPWPPV